MKYKLLFFLVLMLGGSFYLWFGMQSDENVAKTDVSNAPIIENSEEKIAEQAEAVKGAGLTDRKAATSGPSPEYLQATIGNWMKSRGYISKADRDIYRNYSGEVLKELAESGDLNALDALVRQFIYQKDSQTAKEYLKLAAVYGSTFALYELATFSAPKRLEMRDDNRRQSAIIEVMAIARVMDIRGDPGLAREAQRDLNKSYERAHGKALQLAPEDNDAINIRAKELYDSLVEERRKRGLVEFNNEYPAEVREFYGLSK